MIRKRTNPKTPALWLAVGLIALFAASAADARDGRGHHGPPDPAQHVERLSDELDLTAEQATSAQIIFEAHVDRVEALRERFQADEIDREAIREAMLAERESTHAQINSLLDEDQIAAFDALRAERAEHRGRGRGHGRRSDRDSERY